MTTPNQTTLLRRILDHPRVKAYGEGRGWHIQTQIRVCKKCGGQTKVVGLARICADINCLSDKLTLKASGEYYYRGPDLAAESNLHELLGLVDAMGWCPCTVEWECPGPLAFKCEIDYYDHDEDEDVAMQATGHGPTRTLAVLAALGWALGIEVAQ